MEGLVGMGGTRTKMLDPGWRGASFSVLALAPYNYKKLKSLSNVVTAGKECEKQRVALSQN